MSEEERKKRKGRDGCKVKFFVRGRCERMTKKSVLGTFFLLKSLIFIEHLASVWYNINDNGQVRIMNVKSSNQES